jgi:hypothetical protein
MGSRSIRHRSWWRYDLSSQLACAKSWASGIYIVRNLRRRWCDYRRCWQRKLGIEIRDLLGRRHWRRNHGHGLRAGTRIGVISLRGALGLGGTMAAFKGSAERILSRCASGVGGTMLALNIGARCALLLSLRTSGVGATTAWSRVGARCDDFSPSAGAGPGTGLNASRLATAESDCGSLSLGASTTFSRRDSPRATRIV